MGPTTLEPGPICSQVQSAPRSRKRTRPKWLATGSCEIHTVNPRPTGAPWSVESGTPQGLTPPRPSGDAYFYTSKGLGLRAPPTSTLAKEECRSYEKTNHCPLRSKKWVTSILNVRKPKRKQLLHFKGESVEVGKPQGHTPLGPCTIAKPQSHSTPEASGSTYIRVVSRALCHRHPHNTPTKEACIKIPTER